MFSYFCLPNHTQTVKTLQVIKQKRLSYHVSCWIRKSQFLELCSMENIHPRIKNFKLLSKSSNSNRIFYNISHIWGAITKLSWQIKWNVCITASIPNLGNRWNMNYFKFSSSQYSLAMHICKILFLTQDNKIPTNHQVIVFLFAYHIFYQLFA